MARDTPPFHDGYGARGRSAWLDIDWPAHQRWIDVDGTPVNVVELGAGPPLLLVHGLSGCWQNWLENIPHFARTHRVIAVDLPGFGASPLPREPISIAGYARFLEGVCDALSIDAAAVVGNSMGGHIASELAIVSPQRVERLMLVSAAGISAELVQRDAVLTGGRVLAAIMTRAAARNAEMARRPGTRRIALSFVARHPDRLSAPLAHELMQGSGKPGFLPALEAVLTHRISERLPEIACPTFVLWGADDHVIPVRDAKRFGKLIPDVRVEVWPDTGHVAMLERPERFNALLETFLSEQPSPASAARPDAPAESAAAGEALSA
ncbi:MAG TPA: alpha/beta fold hydrolase [Conexibacter sp.]|nr:alpha/beta fold hydrolase [Conexibacter sp.]